MIEPSSFFDLLSTQGIQFFTGVPDSLLKDICAYITETCSSEQHVIAANEGGAVGLAIGHHLASGDIPLVYLQNSGLGNIVNPILSLADKEVYSIPLVILIGWRGQPGVSDEPQHVKQGRITEALLNELEIPFATIPSNETGAKDAVESMVQIARNESRPVALLIPKGTFSGYQMSEEAKTSFPMNREIAIKELVSQLSSKDIIVATTGKASRELFESREALNQGHQQDFLTVGGMGHASQIALGIALNKKERTVYCFDGDGAAIMHLGSLPIIAAAKATNLVHIVINNGAHDSVGGQPTVGFDIDFCAIATASGYESACSVETKEELKIAITEAATGNATYLIEVKVNKGARKELGRPTTTPVENKMAFMPFVES